MYLVTFYSFKGGVGRTMALVNVGFELAREGRKVLFVDFDLEAPGLETFMSCNDGRNAGLVDYVHSYIQENRAPPIRDYVTECTIANDSSATAVWFMSAGRRDAEYGKRLAGIDWKQLYAERNGYLLLEHLKEQWQREFKPDYVLIDSRTGYTEEGGICTRQLPNAVVAMFFPNEQNLNGLRTIVRSIKKRKSTTQRSIKVHPVVANIPHMDDEHGILADTLKHCQFELGCGELSKVHYYQHMDLVNQTVFTLKHPKTRLASEYQALVKMIVQENVEDAAGAKIYLQGLVKKDLSSSDIRDVRERVARILFHHPRNAELLLLAADFYTHADLYVDADAVLSQVAELWPDRAEVKVRSAFVHNWLGREKEAQNDMIKALRARDAGYGEYMLAIQVLRQSKPVLVEQLREAQFDGRLASLDSNTRLALAHELMSDSDLMPIAAYLNESLMEDRAVSGSALSQLTLCLIHLGRFDEVIDRLGAPEVLRSTPDQFNFAMALWAKTGELSQRLFGAIAEVAAKGSGSADDRDPNAHQCFAVAYWATGKVDEAISELRLASEQLKIRPGRHFSCWQYLYLTREEFQADCDALEEMVRGARKRPKFMPNTKRLSLRVN